MHAAQQTTLKSFIFLRSDLKHQLYIENQRKLYENLTEYTSPADNFRFFFKN